MTQRRSIREQVVLIHPQAPEQPDFGEPCNGCGVCCLAEPCPLGMLISHRRRGACGALRWDASTQTYRCGAVAAPAEVLPRWMQGVAPLFARLARRWIAAGQGCDATLRGQPSP